MEIQGQMHVPARRAHLADRVAADFDLLLSHRLAGFRHVLLLGSRAQDVVQDQRRPEQQRIPGVSHRQALAQIKLVENARNQDGTATAG